MAAKKPEQLQLAQDWGDWKVGDIITREQAGDQFEAMNDAGVFAFAPNDPRSTLKPDVEPPPQSAVLDISQLTPEQLAQLREMLFTHGEQSAQLVSSSDAQPTTVTHKRTGTITATWE